LGKHQLLLVLQQIIQTQFDNPIVVASWSWKNISNCIEI
jgi:hypothetical protein